MGDMQHRRPQLIEQTSSVVGLIIKDARDATKRVEEAVERRNPVSFIFLHHIITSYLNLITLSERAL